MNLIHQLGPLRTALITGTVLVLLLRPAPGTPLELEGWGLFLTGVVPVLAPMLFFVLLLDTLMARVYLADTDATGGRSLRTAIRINLLVGAALVLYWAPYFLFLVR